MCKPTADTSAANHQRDKTETPDDSPAVVTSSLIQRNLMSEEGYSPYCGDDRCCLRSPRTVFDGEQFTCRCGWRSRFAPAFIAAYKAKWSK